MANRILLAFALLISASPALAQDTAAVPEGSNVMLFSLGLLGVIVGRRAAISAARRQRARDAEAE